MLKRVPRLALLTGLAVIGLVPAPSALGGPIITRHRIDDRFNGSSIDTNKWLVQNNDPDAVSVTQSGGVISFNAGANASDSFDAFLATRCATSGNFDAQVSFSLPVWPAAAEVNATLEFPEYGVGRSTDATLGDFYGSYLQPLFTHVPTSDLQGHLRLVRRGSTVTSYYRAGDRWVMLNTNPSSPTADTQIFLHVFRFITPFADQPVQVDYDNFHLYAHRIRC